jgi:hypothetical protein
MVTDLPAKRLALAPLLAAAWIALAWMALAGRAHADSTAERAAGLEALIAEKKHAIQALERKNADIQSELDANPLDPGGGFSARTQIRANQRYIAGYEVEITSYERQLAAIRSLAATEEPSRSHAAPSPRPSNGAASGAPPPSAALPPAAAPRSAAVTAASAAAAPIPSPIPSTSDAGDAAHDAGRNDDGPDVGQDGGEDVGLDPTRVHELVGHWARGEDASVLGARALIAAPRAPLAFVLGGLDWSLDWRELSAGASIGAVAGAALPMIVALLLARRLPARAPVVGSTGRKGTTRTNVTGSPSRQWVELAEQSALAVRCAGFAGLALAGFAMLQALAPWLGLGGELAPPGAWGPALFGAGAIAIGGASWAIWRKRVLGAALAAPIALVLVLAVGVARAMSPFGGAGTLAWIVVLAVTALLQTPAVACLWRLSGPRSAQRTARNVSPVTLAVGALAGLGCAVFVLVSA